jgi:hypothetical protein
MNPITQSLDAAETGNAEAEGRVERGPEVARVVLVDENQLRVSTLAASLKAAARATP